tara:strand:- start:231 stop:794 length:564 start_codon:yes stop_codon:yes gene_type:complete
MSDRVDALCEVTQMMNSFRYNLDAEMYPKSWKVGQIVDGKEIGDPGFPLFHGTSWESALKISDEGFVVKHNPNNHLGDGVYFAPGPDGLAKAGSYGLSARTLEKTMGLVTATIPYSALEKAIEEGFIYDTEADYVEAASKDPEVSKAPVVGVLEMHDGRQELVVRDTSLITVHRSIEFTDMLIRFRL